MNNYVFTDNNGKEHKRISKATAHKMFMNNQPFFMVPSNMRPFSMWHPEIEIDPAHCIDIDYGTDNPEETWNTVLNSFRFYNCTAETGKYISFYTA